MLLTITALTMMLIPGTICVAIFLDPKRRGDDAIHWSKPLIICSLWNVLPLMALCWNYPDAFKAFWYSDWAVTAALAPVLPLIVCLPFAVLLNKLFKYEPPQLYLNMSQAEYEQQFVSEKGGE